MKVKFHLIAALLFIPAVLLSQPQWQKIVTVEELCAAYPG